MAGRHADAEADAGAWK